MSSNDHTHTAFPTSPSIPIPVPGSPKTRHGRHRSESVSSSSEEGSTGSTTPPLTPLSSAFPALTRIVSAPNGNPGTSPTSPILSYFMNGSPTRSFPFRGVFRSGPICEEEEPKDISTKLRRASNAASTMPRMPAPFEDSQVQRGAGVLRRLSLSGAFPRPPQFAAPSIAAPTPHKGPAKLAVPASPPRRRAPSPMGERMLKGQYDSFH